MPVVALLLLSRLILYPGCLCRGDSAIVCLLRWCRRGTGGGQVIKVDGILAQSMAVCFSQPLVRAFCCTRRRCNVRNGCLSQPGVEKAFSNPSMVVLCARPSLAPAHECFALQDWRTTIKDKDGAYPIVNQLENPPQKAQNVSV